MYNDRHATAYSIMCDMTEHPQLFQKLSFDQRMELNEVILKKLKEFLK